jgi:hypothetical protein
MRRALVADATYLKNLLVLGIGSVGVVPGNVSQSIGQIKSAPSSHMHEFPNA